MSMSLPALGDDLFIRHRMGWAENLLPLWEYSWTVSVYGWVCVLAAEEELEQTFNEWNHCRWESDFEVGLFYYFRIIRQGLDPSASQHQNQRSPRE